MVSLRNELTSAMRASGKTIDDINYGRICIRNGGEATEVWRSGEDMQSMDGINMKGNISGVVVFKDGSWLERGISTEFWAYRKTPNKEVVFSTEAYCYGAIKQ